MVAVRVGVLALQGDFAEHLAMLRSIGSQAVEVRSCEELEDVAALIIPGGESTTMLKLVDRFELRDALVKRIAGGMPVFGTCAGAIVLADQVSDGERSLGVLPVRIVRNAYGRQQESFEADVDVPELGATLKGVFIRAPVIADPGDAEVMACWADRPVLVRYGSLLAATFHPELSGEVRIHRYFVEQMCKGTG
ncbi:MAG: pyridoxal 5'-phosphate synthase glutaminase subunit PdxT [Actinomycetota bacterium]